MRLLHLIAVAITALASGVPALAGPEMPMYQFPQSKQMQMLPPPKPRDVSCTPATTPSPQGDTQVMTADATANHGRFHVVDGKCVPMGGT